MIIRTNAVYKVGQVIVAFGKTYRVTKGPNTWCSWGKWRFEYIVEKVVE